MDRGRVCPFLGSQTPLEVRNLTFGSDVRVWMGTFQRLALAKQKPVGVTVDLSVCSNLSFGHHNPQKKKGIIVTQGL